MAIGSPVLYADFSGGINLEAGPYLVSENECQDAENVTASSLGSIQKRNGSTILSHLKISHTHVFDGPVHSLFAANTSSPVLLVVGPYASNNDDAIAKVSGSGTVTVLKDNAEPDTRWAFAQGPTGNPGDTDEGPIYGLNGIDDPQYWDGTSASTAEWTSYNYAGTPFAVHPAKECTLLLYHLDKMWAAGDPDNPGRIYATGPNATTDLPDPCNWDSDYIDDVEPFDGEIITALGKVGPYLLVFKNRKTYVLTDPTSGAYRPISSSVGCVAPRSVVETTQGTFFLSEDLGVCVTDGSTIRTVSDKIEPLLQGVANSQPLNITKAAACYFEDSYYLSIPYESSTNSITLEYNLSTGSWWKHTLTSNQYALLDPQGTPKLYAAHAQSRQIDRLFVPDVYYDGDPTDPVSCYWKGPYWAWGQPHLNKRINQMRIDGKGDWTASMAETFGDSYEEADGENWEQAQTSTVLWGVGSDKFGDVDTEGGTPITGRLFGPQPGVLQKRYYTPVEGWGRAWSLQLSSSSSNDWQIYSVAMFSRARTD
jgi:hypothetical protein